MLSVIPHNLRRTLQCLPQNISGYIIWNSFRFSAHSPLSALCSFCMAFTHCVLNFNPAMLQQFPLYLTQKAETSYLCLVSCYCAGVMPPDLEKKKKEIQMAHVPQLMSEAQIRLVSARLGAKERYITGQNHSDWEFPLIQMGNHSLTRGCWGTFRSRSMYLCAFYCKISKKIFFKKINKDDRLCIIVSMFLCNSHFGNPL